MMDKKRRVVITGVGAVTLGCNKETFWKNLLSGTSGIGELSKLMLSHIRTRSAEVMDLMRCRNHRIQNSKSRARRLLLMRGRSNVPRRCGP